MTEPKEMRCVPYCPPTVHPLTPGRAIHGHPFRGAGPFWQKEARHSLRPTTTILANSTVLGSMPMLVELGYAQTLMDPNLCRGRTRIVWRGPDLLTNPYGLVRAQSACERSVWVLVKWVLPSKNKGSKALRTSLRPVLEGPDPIRVT